MVAKIRLEVLSGALGVPILRKELDCAELDGAQQAKLQQLIGASGALQLPGSPPPSKVRDSNQTKLVFEISGQKQTVRIAEESISTALRDLIDFVKANGR